MKICLAAAASSRNRNQKAAQILIPGHKTWTFCELSCCLFCFLVPYWMYLTMVFSGIKSKGRRNSPLCHIICLPRLFVADDEDDENLAQKAENREERFKSRTLSWNSWTAFARRISHGRNLHLVAAVSNYEPKAPTWSTELQNSRKDWKVKTWGRQCQPGWPPSFVFLLASMPGIFFPFAR